MTSAPILSVVVAATDSAGAVARCVESIGGRDGIELIVVAPGWIGPGQGGLAGVRWIVAEAGVEVPGLRRLGWEQAKGSVVAFTEDSCRLAPGWAEGWIAAFRDPTTLAATGPVEHEAGGSAVDWAVFFCEYAPFLGPSGSSGAGRLAGNNFAVRRDWLARTLKVGEDVHESNLACYVEGAGGRVVAVGESRAWHVRRFGLREALRDRLRFGFAFGRLRAESAPGSVRFLAVAAGPGILLSQIGRLGWTLACKRRHRERFAAGLPLTAALLAAWSVGEWLGWICGAGSTSRAGGGVVESPRGRGPIGPFLSEHGREASTTCASSSPRVSRAATFMRATWSGPCGSGCRRPSSSGSAVPNWPAPGRSGSSR